MKKIDLGQTLQVLSNVAVLAGIILLAYEIRQSTLATQVAAADGYISSLQAQNYLVVADPGLIELLQKGATDAELTSVEETRINAILSTYLQNLQRALFLFDQGVLPESVWNTQLATLARGLPNDPRFMDYWSQRRDDYDPRLNELMERLLRK